MAGASLHALVIEDEGDVLDLLRSHLDRLGCRVSGAQTGIGGLRLSREDPPDLVFVDIMLPDIDGREVIRLLRADARTAECRIVLCTVLDAEHLAGIPADAVLPKPFVKADVINVMELFTPATPEGGQP